MLLNPADEPRQRTVVLSDEEAGHLKAAILMCMEMAHAAQDGDLFAQYQILLERVERA